MLHKEDFAVIKTLNQRGVYLKDIAAELGVHPRTVRRALQRQAAPHRERKPAPSKLEPHKAKMDELLTSGVWNARVILREIQAQGYTGGYTILRDYLAPKRALRPGRATVRFETPPGQQLQTDWGEISVELAGAPTVVDFIVNTLGYSRRFHFWCTDSQDAEHTYEGLIWSFEYFGGVTQEVLVDNQKCAVLIPSKQGQPRFNERFLDLAQWYGFTPHACRPYRARTKGKDERMVEYLKGNFFVRYWSFESWVHLNQLAEHWLAKEADQRVHGSVKEVVAEWFARERPCLGPLPAQRYDTAYQEYRQVGWDGYIDVRGNRYSVPAELVHQTVLIRLSLEGQLRVYQADQVVASHTLRQADQGWSTLPEHHAALWRDILHVERRPLQVYEEASTWN